MTRSHFGVKDVNGTDFDTICLVVVTQYHMRVIKLLEMLSTWSIRRKMQCNEIYI